MKRIALAPAVLAALLPLAAAVAPPALAQPATAPPRAEQPRVTPWPSESGVSQLFHVTLVAASKTGGGTAAGNLPKGVAKALDDIKDFLPYQGYRVVDSALVRASSEAHPRLKGPDGTIYTADMVFREASQEGGVRSFLVEYFELSKMPRIEDLERMLDDDRPGRPALAPLAPEPNLTASFRIAKGETVVVGSSRLDGGDDALIVLLTAVP
jgi:hypothetical protein